LEAWRHIVEPYHIIILQDGDPDVAITVPAWCDYELHNHNSILEALGEDAWIISHRDSALRSYGFLVSQKKYVFTLDDDTLPSPFYPNPIEAHMRNLLTNSTPFYFNTLYDPFREGSDFVRGYPFSLRAGVRTVLSHGLWLSTPDYDAPTQLLKASERNAHVVDAAVTVPRGILYPMCGMNLAFDREIAGVLLLFGLMGDGQPWARYDDMIAGWASKVCIDKLSLGVKTGIPYTNHVKASDPFVNLQKEYMGILWQEDIVRFFDQVQLSHAAAASPAACYRELANHWEAALGHLNPYFPRFAQAMRLWIKYWEKRQRGKLALTPARAGAPDRLPMT
jgi:reversibly glycosylated polypeptide / UDP-arabinopyranose mutase